MQTIKVFPSFFQFSNYYYKFKCKDKLLHLKNNSEQNQTYSDKFGIILFSDL